MHCAAEAGIAVAVLDDLSGHQDRTVRQERADEPRIVAGVHDPAAAGGGGGNGDSLSVVESRLINEPIRRRECIEEA